MLFLYFINDKLKFFTKLVNIKLEIFNNGKFFETM